MSQPKRNMRPSGPATATSRAADKIAGITQAKLILKLKLPEANITSLKVRAAQLRVSLADYVMDLHRRELKLSNST